MSTALSTLTQKLADRLDMGDGSQLIETLKATAFKGSVTDAQMTALMVVANQYGLNPWTKEIYAFPDKQNGIVPVVGVDGWSRIINEHPQFDGMEFRQSEIMVLMDGARNPAPEWMECIIYRKDRSRPMVIREYLDEVYRPPFKKDNGYQVDGPWQTHTKRFMRHKTMIQAARLTFGYTGIYDQDEAERIVGEKDVTQHSQRVQAPQQEQPTLPTYSDEEFAAKLLEWQGWIDGGKTNAERIIKMSASKVSLTNEQKQAILDLEVTNV